MYKSSLTEEKHADAGKQIEAGALVRVTCLCLCIACGGRTDQREDLEQDSALPIRGESLVLGELACHLEGPCESHAIRAFRFHSGLVGKQFLTSTKSVGDVGLAIDVAVSHGAFRAEDVPPGTYAFWATPPDASAFSTLVGPVEVIAGAATRLPAPVVLDLGATVAVEIPPRLDLGVDVLGSDRMDDSFGLLFSESWYGGVHNDSDSSRAKVVLSGVPPGVAVLEWGTELRLAPVSSWLGRRATVEVLSSGDSLDVRDLSWSSAQPTSIEVSHLGGCKGKVEIHEVAHPEPPSSGRDVSDRLDNYWARDGERVDRLLHDELHWTSVWATCESCQRTGGAILRAGRNNLLVLQRSTPTRIRIRRETLLAQGVELGVSVVVDGCEAKTAGTPSELADSGWTTSLLVPAGASLRVFVSSDFYLVELDPVSAHDDEGGVRELVY